MPKKIYCLISLMFLLIETVVPLKVPLAKRFINNSELQSCIRDLKMPLEKAKETPDELKCVSFYNLVKTQLKDPGGDCIYIKYFQSKRFQAKYEELIKDTVYGQDSCVEENEVYLTPDKRTILTIKVQELILELERIILKQQKRGWLKKKKDLFSNHLFGIRY